MGIIWSVIIGFVIGVLAKFLHPGKENFGFIATTVLGILGSVGAAFVGQQLGWYAPDEGAGFIASVIMAVILLFAYTKIKSK
ncbi:GlsB/YeaQ/YmgE family stress response membrane protein [Neisseria shayeganii]|uniref:GlsB/YeaQ/YmgE family stress response membrane protein n=1 Tax=Neisseria shayeganii TaxID=607712 RepID=A0A7D7N4K2_9NEIS|nr:GlsB/YeaQ/YmgE family stress response membrane protein [Neisseria shayeganii]QMT41345.1 GlsB/YeaQ/YmgE family stress response membrane protein [Neisseria shayeganii]